MSIVARLNKNNLASAYGNVEFTIEYHETHYTCHCRETGSELGRGPTAIAAALAADHHRCDIAEALSKA